MNKNIEKTNYIFCYFCELLNLISIMDFFENRCPSSVTQANTIAAQNMPRLTHLHPWLRGKISYKSKLLEYRQYSISLCHPFLRWEYIYASVRIVSGIILVFIDFITFQTLLNTARQWDNFAEKYVSLVWFSNWFFFCDPVSVALSIYGCALDFKPLFAVYTPRIVVFKIWGFYGGDYEECHLLGCGAV
jgi:hypothetical protein